MSFNSFEFLIEGVFLLIVACVGIAANVLGLIFFARKKPKHSFYRCCNTHRISVSVRWFIPSLMMCLCSYHLVYVITSLLIFAFPLLLPPINLSALFTRSIPYMLTIAHVAVTGRNYLFRLFYQTKS